MTSLIRELKLAGRRLWARPLFTLTIVLTIGLGMGAVAAIVSVGKAVFVDPLPYRQPETLMSVLTSFPEEGVERQSLSYPDFLDWREESDSLSDLAVYSQGEPLVLEGEDDAELIQGELVSAGYFRLLGIEPVVGRPFSEAEAEAGEPVVLLGHDVWRSRFAESEEVVGRSVTLSDRRYTVLGVMPEGFRGLSDDASVWLPVQAMTEIRSPATLESRRSRWLFGVGRLAAPDGLEAARSELETLAARLADEYPDSNEGASIAVRPLAEEYFGEMRRGLALLTAGAVLLLLVSCVNVTNLLVAHALLREGELAVHVALGAGRRHLFRQRLAESILLVAAGTALGLWLASWGGRALLAASSVELVSSATVDLDPGVLAVTFVITTLVTVAFALLPTFVLSRIDPASALKEGGRGGVGGGRNLLRRSLVVAEVALTLVLLVTAGLMLKGYRQLLGNDLGIDTENLLVAELTLSSERYADPEVRRSLAPELLDRSAALPGVESSALAAPGVAPAGLWYLTFIVEDWVASRPDALARGYFHQVSPGYFRTLGIPLLQGRDFTRADTDGAPGAAILSRGFAEEVWPGESALGKRLRINQPGQEENWLTVVGLVEDAEQRGFLYESDSSDIYLPYFQFPSPRVGLLTRTARDATASIPLVRRALEEVDPYLPVEEWSTMADRMGEDVAEPRFRVLLIGLFAAVTLLLAMIGLYGVVAYSATQRSREMGIRLALGAARSRVVRTVLWEGMGVALAGLVAGLVLAYLAGRAAESFLFGVSTTDLPTYAVVTVLLLAVTLAASLLPALRASRVDPAVVLRDA